MLKFDKKSLEMIKKLTISGISAFRFWITEQKRGIGGFLEKVNQRQGMNVSRTTFFAMKSSMN